MLNAVLIELLSLYPLLGNELEAAAAGTFCLFEYRALFCVIWSFFGKKWPKSDGMIHRALHLLDI